jgi:hypothetical protein
MVMGDSVNGEDRDRGAGQSAVLLEADRIVTEVTGYTTGRLSAAHPWIYAPLRDSLGAEAARLYATSQQEAVDYVVDTAAAGQPCGQCAGSGAVGLCDCSP